MSRTRLLAAPAVALLIALGAACGDDDEASAPAPPVSTAGTRTEPPAATGTPAVDTVELRPGRRAPVAITVAVGQQFAVQVEENPAAGPPWRYTESGIAVTLVEDAVTYTPFDDGPEGRAAGGVREWRFTATRAGEGELSFTLGDPARGGLGAGLALTVTP